MVANSILHMNLRWFAWGLLSSLLLSACSTVPTEPITVYSNKARHDLYKLTHWSFEGRLAVTSPKDSWSANIVWKHSPAEDKLKLVGPLGQGAVIIQLKGNKVIIDRGGGDVRWSEHPEEFVNQELGMFVPVQSLRYWVIGLPEPSIEFQEMGEGFSQAGWLTEFKQMQSVDNQSMPKKIAVLSKEVKLKLFIDHWDLIDVKTK